MLELCSVHGNVIKYTPTKHPCYNLYRELPIAFNID